MGSHQRTKGAGGEREFAGLVMDHLGVRMVRNLVQARSGGCDLIVCDTEEGPVADMLRRLAVEVKRSRRATGHLLQKWWVQAMEQARADDLVPCLAYREDRQPWRVVVPMSFVREGLHRGEGVEWTFTTSAEGFCALVRELA